MKSFREDVERAVAYHGHLCSGQCIGVKMARYGLAALGLDPETDRKRIYVFVECDRCPADAIAIVTGCRVGRRTFRVMDYGKVAASFLDVETGRAVRVQRKQRRYPAEGEDMIAFYEALDPEEIFKLEPVSISLRPQDLPGPVTEACFCELCGEDVTDGRHVLREGRKLCRSCAGEGYYRPLVKRDEA